MGVGCGKPTTNKIYSTNIVGFPCLHASNVIRYFLSIKKTKKFFIESSETWSVQVIRYQRIKKTLEAIKHGTGSDKNLNLKNTIEQIRLLKDQIQITFFYKDHSWHQATPTPHLTLSEEIRVGGQAKNLCKCSKSGLDLCLTISNYVS